MKSEQKLRDFTLRLIQILVWFLILWAVVFLAGLVFQWSGLTDQLSSAFYGSGFCAVIVLAALALLNLTANMNIISKAQVRRVASDELIESTPNSFVKNICVAGALIGLIVSSLWFAEWRLHQAKVAEAEAQIESLVDSPLLTEAANLIAKDGTIAQLAEVREALGVSIQSGAQLSLIIKRSVKDVPASYELTAWWYGSQDNDAPISKATLNRFIPRYQERSRWKRLVAGEINYFTVPVGDHLRSFRRAIYNDTEIILLLDTARRSDYSRGSFK